MSKVKRSRRVKQVNYYFVPFSLEAALSQLRQEKAIRLNLCRLYRAAVMQVFLSDLTKPKLTTEQEISQPLPNVFKLWSRPAALAKNASYIPRCGTCGEAVTDARNAIVVIAANGDRHFPATFYITHKGPNCDRMRGAGWIPLSDFLETSFMQVKHG